MTGKRFESEHAVIEPWPGAAAIDTPSHDAGWTATFTHRGIDSVAQL